MRIVIADDHELVRFAMRDVLTVETDLEVVGEAANGCEAVDVVRETRPDVVLLDLRMPEMDGIEACARIAEESPETRILVISSFDAPADIQAALSGGADGYILKDSAPASLLHAVRDVACGRVVLDRNVAVQAIGPQRRQQPENVLSGREQEVLELMAEGLRNREIAQRLWVSEPTVKTHVSRIIRKLGQQDRTQAVLEAMRCGLVTPGRPSHPRG